MTIGFVVNVVFIVTEEITSDEDYTGSVITTLLVSSYITDMRIIINNRRPV